MPIRSSHTISLRNTKLCEREIGRESNSKIGRESNSKRERESKIVREREGERQTVADVGVS